MLSEFEQGFQATLRTKLPVEIRDQVEVATGAPNQSGILVGIRSAKLASGEFGSVRSEFAPGMAVRRRVVRMHCVLDCIFVPANNSQDRTLLMSWLDQVLYALDDFDVRTGAAFAGTATDPGFLIQSMKVEALDSPFGIHETESERLGLSLKTDGWFWPVGELGEASVEIGEIRIRGAIHPLLLTPAEPRLVANGPGVDLSISFEPRGTSRITTTDLSSEAFGHLAIRLEKVDGTAGEGTLGGGTAGAGNIRLLPVTDDQVHFSYTPSATPGTDILIVCIDDNSSSGGIEIGRYTLITGASP